jgi:hypothetical protein
LTGLHFIAERAYSEEVNQGFAGKGIFVTLVSFVSLASDVSEQTCTLQYMQMQRGMASASGNDTLTLKGNKLPCKSDNPAQHIVLSGQCAAVSEERQIYVLNKKESW